MTSSVETLGAARYETTSNLVLELEVGKGGLIKTWPLNRGLGMQ